MNAPQMLCCLDASRSCKQDWAECERLKRRCKVGDTEPEGEPQLLRRQLQESRAAACEAAEQTNRLKEQVSCTEMFPWLVAFVQSKISVESRVTWRLITAITPELWDS